MTQLSLPVPTAIQQAKLVSHKTATDVLNITISMPPSNPVALQAFVDSVSNPKSANYGKWATPAQLGLSYGQPQAIVTAITTYLQSKGFKITLVGDSRMAVMATATVAQAESAFGTTINNYHSLLAITPNRTDFYAFDEPLKVPASFANAVLSVSGLDNVVKPHPLLRKHVTLSATAKKAAALRHARFNTDPLTPTQTRTLYGVAPMWTANLEGQGMNLAISSFDGFLLSNVPLYYSKFALPTPPGGVGSNIKIVTIDGGSQSNTPGGEADLDIQMVLGMAPLCNFTIYDGGSLIDVLTKEQNDNIADVTSESYGWELPASDAEACHNVHLLMNAQGMTYVKATGDSGTTLEPFAYGDYDPEIFLVGGSIANTDAAGNRLNETAWSGGGGGWATDAVPFNVLPSFQKGKGVPTNINFRLVPDVALNAAGDTTGAYQFFFNGDLFFGADGTSFASPVFCGGLGVALQKVRTTGGSKKRLGRIQDVVYSQNGRSDVWFDITTGSNGTLPNGNFSSAGAFWDFCTGWGSINFNQFAQSISVTPPTLFNVSSINPFDNTGLNPPVVEGSNPIGVAANLSSANGEGYSLTAVKEAAVGQVATMQATFNTTFSPGKLTSLAFVMSGTVSPEATIQIYLLNQSTGKFQLQQSIAGSSINSLMTLPVTLTPVSNYMSSTGQVQALFRYLVPNSRTSQLNNYTFFMDQLQLSAVQSLD